MSENTRALVQKFIEHIEAQQFDAAYRMLNPNGRFTLLGKTPASGTFNGIDEFLERLAPFVSNFKVWPSMRFSDTVVDGDKAFLRASGRGEGLFGPYEQPFYGFYIRVEGSGFAELIEFLDPTQLEIAVFGKKLVAA
jgi:hypothetical protein